MKVRVNRDWKGKNPIKVELDESDFWNANVVIASIAAPLLRQFKEKTTAIPSGLTQKQWDYILDEMIFAFEHHLNHDSYSTIDIYMLDPLRSAHDRYRAMKGLEYFAKYFAYLWD